MKCLAKLVAVSGLCLLSAAHTACGADASPTKSNSGEVVEDHEWMALVDSDDSGGFSFDETPRAVKLSDFGAEKRPGTKLIMLVAAAGWCSPCQSEAAALSKFAADFEDQGVAVLTAVIQDTESNQADAKFAHLWGENFKLTIPTLIDAEFETGKYFSLSQMPATMLIDAETFEIITIEIGADTGADPLGKYRELVKFHLSQR